MTRLAVAGAGGHAKVVADAALASGWSDVAFYDDNLAPHSQVGPWVVAGSISDLLAGVSPPDGVIVAVGDNAVRLELQRKLEGAGLRVVSVIHPAAVVSTHASIGAGSVILAGAVVNASACLGRGCIVNTCASVDHDCLLADGVHVSPGAHLGGGVAIGSASWIGIGASVKQGVRIGARVVVGAGGAVVSDVPDGTTVVGVPARPLRS